MSRLRTIANKWWFYLLLLIIPVFLQPYTTNPMSYEQVGELMGEVLRESLTPYSWIAPILHVATAIFIVLLWKFKSKVSRIFYAYLASNFVFMAFAQNITVTDEFGFVIVLNNLLHILIIGVLFVPAFARGVYFESVKLEKWRFLLLPLAVLAFWAPMSPIGQPDFSPILLLTSSYGLAFCFTAPVIIFVFTLFYPNVFKPAYWFLCIVGVYFAVLNLAGPFMISGYPYWVAFLHLPLLVISLYGLILAKMKHQTTP
jgi:hypothetical protein